jgi:hypothetical protein
MAINIQLFKRLILITLFLFGSSVLQAQTLSYFLDPNSAEPRFVQRLEWSGGMYSLRYEVIIEKESGEAFVRHLTEFTTNNFVYLSLPPGNYRFRIISYNILDKPSTETQWMPLNVINAIKPVLYKPGKDMKYINDERGYIFVFDGKDIDPDAEGYFVSSKGKRIDPVEIINNDDGSSISLVFGKDQLLDGKYEVFVVNPGGFEESLDGINFKAPFKKIGSTIFTIGVSWMPLYPVYGDRFGHKWIFSNMVGWMSISSYIASDTYFGLELFFSKCMGGIVYGPDGFTAGYNLLLTKWMPSQKAAYNFKMGLSYTPQPMNCGYLNMGVSAMLRLTQILNFESGINYTHSINDNTGGGILPWAGISLLF